MSCLNDEWTGLASQLTTDADAETQLKEQLLVPMIVNAVSSVKSCLADTSPQDTGAGPLGIAGAF